MDDLLLNPAPYKDASLTDKFVLNNVGSQNYDTFLYSFRCVRPDERDEPAAKQGVPCWRRLIRWIMAAKLNISFLNQAGCIAEMSEI